jgi:acyl-CoA synthetase (AMP-forming)/AMP-acid ligase II
LQRRIENHILQPQMTTPDPVMWQFTLPDVLAQHARSRAAQTAVVCADERLTWLELDRRVRQLAGALRAAGVQRSDRVLWLAQGCHRLLEALLACGRLGAVFAPVNWRQTADELAFVLHDAEPSVVFWQEAEIGDAVQAARASWAGQAPWVCHDDGGYEAFLASGALDERIDAEPDDGVLMIYTGAFGGRPNGAVLSHRAVLTQNVVIALVYGIEGGDVFLNSGPLFHLGTLMRTFATFHLGGTNVFVPRVDAEEICQIIEREHCTGAFLMPPTMAQMIDVNRDGRYDLKSLRTGPGLPAWEAMVSVDPAARPAGGTGQTEVMGLVTFQAFGGSGAHGRPSPMAQVRIHHEDDRECQPGDVGEIVVRGPVVMNGYHNRPELNAAKQRNGWHHTGDLGRIEPDGSVTFIGPKARMIKSAAENIYPAEVEACLAAHPAVREAAVIGVPDDVWAQSVKAIIAVRDGAAVTADELIEHCRAHIASYKKPRTIEFVNALPRQGFAVDYDALDETFGGGGYPGGWNRSV